METPSFFIATELKVERLPQSQASDLPSLSSNSPRHSLAGAAAATESASNSLAWHHLRFAGIELGSLEKENLSTLIHISWFNESRDDADNVNDDDDDVANNDTNEKNQLEIAAHCNNCFISWVSLNLKLPPAKNLEIYRKTIIASKLLSQIEAIMELPSNPSPPSASYRCTQTTFSELPTKHF